MSERKSKYATKVASKKQMYGNGRQCCGHRYVADILAKAKNLTEEVRDER